MKHSNSLLILFIVAVLCFANASAQTLTYSKSALTITKEKSTDIKKITVELRPQEFLNSDLIINNKLPDGEGIFVELADPAPIAVPLGNVFIERDFVFVDEEAKVVGIAENFSASSEKIFPEPGEEFMVKGLLQLNAGDVEKYGIKIGDKIALDGTESKE